MKRSKYDYREPTGWEVGRDIAFAVLLSAAAGGISGKIFSESSKPIIVSLKTSKGENARFYHYLNDNPFMNILKDNGKLRASISHLENDSLSFTDSTGNIYRFAYTDKLPEYMESDKQDFIKAMQKNRRIME